MEAGNDIPGADFRPRDRVTGLVLDCYAEADRLGRGGFGGTLFARYDQKCQAQDNEKGVFVHSSPSLAGIRL